MVSANVFAPILQRALGKYLDLDVSGINVWSGDIKLKDLRFKETILDDLDLPIKLKSGFLSHLTLKIPWGLKGQINKERTIADVGELFILVVPNKGVVYNKNREEKLAQDAKQKTLKNLEEARKAKRKAGNKSESGGWAAGMVESMVSAIIRNLQVSVEKIHIRFEDEFTNRDAPFATGITLDKFSFQTTDKDWNPALETDITATLLRKLLELSALSIYWNPETELISRMNDTTKIKSAFSNGIAKKDAPAPAYTYMIQPLSISAHLEFVPKPEKLTDPLSLPKGHLTVSVDSMDFVLGKLQYRNLLKFLEELERFNLSAKYRKFRPDLKGYKGNAKRWWKFAFACVLEENVRRRRRNWSWQHIKKHRMMMKEYQKAWLAHITEKNPSAKSLKTIKDVETEKDVFNLNVARQQAEFEVDRKKLTRIDDQPQGWLDWMGWGSGNAEKPKEDTSNPSQEGAEETKNETANDIDVDATKLSFKYPESYVEFKMSFKLGGLSISILDQMSKGKILEVTKLQFSDVNAAIDYRTAAKGLKLKASIYDMILTGLTPSSGKPPTVIHVAVARTDKTATLPLFQLVVQTNPLVLAKEEKCDVSIYLRGQPLNLVYHAPTVNRLVKVFRPPEMVELNQITAAAMAKYEDVKFRSSSQLAMAVEKRSKMALDIHFMPSLIMIPEAGIYTKSSHILLIDMGSLALKTVKKPEEALIDTSIDQDPAMAEIMDKACDNFQVEVKSVQILFSGPKDDWIKARRSSGTNLHFLNPTGFKILLRKSGVEDPQIPKLQIIGKLPEITMNLSETSLLSLLKLVLSIPTPERSDMAAALDEQNLTERAKMMAILEANESELLVADDSCSDSFTPLFQDPEVSQVNLKLLLVLDKVKVHMSRSSKGRSIPYMEINATGFRASMEKKTFDIRVDAEINSLALEHMELKAAKGKDNLYLIRKPVREASNGKPLLHVLSVQANKKGPFFATQFNSTEQLVEVNFEGLDINLQQEALQNIQDFTAQLQEQIASVQNKASSLERSKLKRNDSVISLGSLTTSLKEKLDRNQQIRTSDLTDNVNVKTKIRATLGAVIVDIGFKRNLFASIQVEEVIAAIETKAKTVDVTASLRNISILDPSAKKYKKILKVSGTKEMLCVAFTQFKRTAEEKKAMKKDDVDMSVKVHLAAMEFVFLQLWLNKLMCWLVPFQAVADEAAVQAGIAVSGSAKHAAEAVQESIPKVRLDVDLAAPIIIVPQNSSASEALYANLGRLTIGNSFTEKEVDSGMAFFESLNIGMTEMKLSRVIIPDIDAPLSAEVQLLEPVTFELNITRNLSFEWYKGQAEVEIKGHLPVIKMSMSEEDYAMIIKTLAQNFNEGRPPPKKRPTKTEDVVPDSDEYDDERVTSKTVTSSPKTKTVNRVLIDLTFDGLWAGLYVGTSNLSNGVSKRKKRNFLGQLHVTSLVAKGTVRDNGSMQVTVHMTSFTIDDSRKGQTGITRLMDKKTTNSQNLIDVNFSRDPVGNKKVDVKLRPYYLCFAPDFIFSLTKFFIIQLENDENTEIPVTGRETNTVKRKKRKTPSSEDKGAISVNFVMEDPEIIIVEDASNPSETQALFLKVKVEAKYEVGKGVEKFSAAVKSLELFSTFYDKDKQNIRLQVLNSLDITLLHSITQEEEKIDIRFGDVTLRVSPPVIRLLSAVAAKGHRPKAVLDPVSERKKQLDKEEARVKLWDTKPLEDGEFWFIASVLPKEEAQDIFEDESSIDDLLIPLKQQKLYVQADSIAVQLEVGTEEKTIPLIFLESSFNAQVMDWTSKLEADAVVKLQIAYYNEHFNCWEPILEPVLSKNGTQHRHWELQIQARHGLDGETAPVKPDEPPPIPPPKMAITLVATDPLELTLTKTSIEMLGTISDHFHKALILMKPSKMASLPGTSPYVVLNETGLPAQILESEFLEHESLKKAHTVPHGGYAFMTAKQVAKENKRTSILQALNSSRAILTVRMSSMKAGRELDVSRSELRAFSLPIHSDPGKSCVLISEVTTDYGRKKITLRSMIKVKNEMNVDAEVYYMVNTTLKSCGLVKSNEEKNIPIPVLYTPTGELYFKAAINDYEISSQPIIWTTFKQRTTNKTLRCKSIPTPKVTYHIQTSARFEEVYFENTSRRSVRSHSWTIFLQPRVTFHNIMPYPVEIYPENMPLIALKKGENAPLPSLAPGSVLKLKIIEDRTWNGSLRITEKPEELSTITFDSDKAKMDFGIHTSESNGSFDYALYCPFWMVNKTGLNISYKGSDSGKVTEHPIGSKNPLMFALNGDDFFKSKKITFRVSSGDWTDGVPVDAVGTASKVSSKTKDDLCYDMSVGITLGTSKLTKTVTIAPFYLIQNNSKYAIEVREVDHVLEKAVGTKWITIPPESCSGLYPKSTGKERLMCARYACTKEETLPFTYKENYEMFFRLLNKLVGINISCSITDHSVLIRMEDFEEGMAPALLINHTRFPLHYKQVKDQHTSELKPHHKKFFSWSNHVGSREFVWSMGDAKDVRDGLFKDALKDFKAGKETIFYWVSFLSGRQRVLLYTEDIAVATTANEAYELERVDRQITFSLEGMGLSLVNNVAAVDVLYIRMQSSGIVWEGEKGIERYKAFSFKDCAVLEAAYDKFNGDKHKHGSAKSTVQAGRYLVDFNSELEPRVLKPWKGRIRRTTRPGLWIQKKTSPHLDQVHLKLNHLQIDNMLPACVFQTVLAPVPPPKSVAADSVPKPFVELSFVKKQTEKSQIQQIKYYKILVQEMAFKADDGIINALISLVSSEKKSSAYSPEDMEADLKLANTDLSSLAISTSGSGSKTYYDDLHFSPLKIHVSFSLSGGREGTNDGKPTGIQSELVNLVLKSVGVTLTDIQDVVFKMAFFERRNVFMTRTQMAGEVVEHYTKQALKQLYVLVLGLDIIGNPFGLIRDLSTGVEDLFYEPIQGAIQGPEEFAQGLALGVKSLFGHAVGGAAGAVGRITGTLGKGIAALTLDYEYQKKRREALNRRPANARVGLAQGGKGLVMGVVDGMTGVFIKPWEGAKTGGAVGFAKGVGKGIIGVFTRPVAGVVDFANSSFDAVKKVSEVSQEVKRIRPPRFIPPDRIIRPYSLSDAEGSTLLKEAEKGKYAKTDYYVAHGSLLKDKNDFFFITDRRVMIIERNEVFGNWEVKWQYCWNELASSPKLTEKGLRFELKERRKKWLIGPSFTGKLVILADTELAKKIAEKAQLEYQRERQ